MGLDEIAKEGDIVSVPAVTFSLEKISAIISSHPRSYEVRFHSGTGVGIKKENKDFRDGLKEGDYVIIAREAGTVKMVYGPVDEKKLYTN